MYLVVNTIGPKGFVALLSATGEVSKMAHFAAERKRSERTLNVIQSVLAAKKAKLSSLRGIAVVNGGNDVSFTALRIGVSIVNALAWALQIPNASITAAPDDTPRQLAAKAYQALERSSRPRVIEPAYSAPPNISKAKVKL